MFASAIPRTLARVGLTGLRIPFSVAQRLIANGEVDWPPAIAFDALEAELKIFLGSLLRDEGLLHEGTLQRGKTHEVATASYLEESADTIRAWADTELEQTIDSVGEAARQCEADARDRAEQIRLERAVEEEKLQEESQARRDASARRASAREKAVQADEREAERTRIAAESAALSARSQALSAAKRAKAAEERLEARKTARK